SPKTRFDAREELQHLKRFRQVVIRAEAEAGDSVRDVAARSQHQDRNVGARLAELATNREPVALRKADVEHDAVERAGAREVEGGVAVGREHDLVTLAS